jgi:hypothetical protein
MAMPAAGNYTAEYDPTRAGVSTPRRAAAAGVTATGRRACLAVCERSVSLGCDHSGEALGVVQQNAEAAY